MAEELRETATGVARAVLLERWTPERFELELESEHAPQWNHLFDRSHYAATFRVFELADTALVSVGARGDVLRVTLPALATPDPERRAQLAPDVVARVRQAAEDAARRAGRWQTLRSSVSAVQRPASGEPGAVDVLVRLHASAPEGSLTVDLDAGTGERLAYFVPGFLRGSRGGRALSRREVQARVEESGVLPPGLRVARAELEEPLGARLWRLRYEAADLERTGSLVVCAHARSGAVVGQTSTLRPRVRLGRGPTRERAFGLLTRALPHLLGPESRLANLVGGAVVGRGPARAGWVGTAVTGEGVVVRVSIAGDEVEARVQGKIVRARVESERVTVVQPRCRVRGSEAPPVEVATESVLTP